jgi:hypothetical protein
MCSTPFFSPFENGKWWIFIVIILMSFDSFIQPCSPCNGPPLLAM